MVERLVIIGAGYVGLALAEKAGGGGLEVVGTTRSDQTEQRLAAMGQTALRWDVLEDSVEPVADRLGPRTAVVYSVPTIYREYASGAGDLARHVAPVARVVQACRKAGVARFIYLSSTSVYGDKQARWVDESAPLEPSSAYGKMRRDIERFVVGAADEMATNVARLVGIYGPGRTMVDYLKSGRYKLVDGGTKPSNRVHVADIVQALMAMIGRGGADGAGAGVFNVSDGNPKTVVEVVDFLVDHLGIDRPAEISLAAYADQRGPNAAARWTNTYRCRNDRMVDELGVDLDYPDVFAGYRAIFGL